MRDGVVNARRARVAFRTRDWCAFDPPSRLSYLAKHAIGMEIRLNLKELARTLGLSPTTVSRALNGYSDVSAATRTRVKDAATRHGYRPNPRARGLATGRAMAIGHVIPLAERPEMMNPVFADFITGAGETYSAAGYDLHMSIVPRSREMAAYREVVARQAVDGLIVHAPATEDPRIPLLRDLGLPFVVHGRAGAESGPYSWVDVDNERAFREATEHLIGLGHRSIALVNGPEVQDFACRRRKGHEDALRYAGIEPSLHHQAEMSEGEGFCAAQRMLASDSPPTAFVAASMPTALGIRRAIGEAGLVMGADVSVVTHDDRLGFLANEGDDPPFTATRSSVREAGRRAAAMLLEIVADPDGPSRSDLMTAELVVGRSTGPAPR